MPLVQLAAAFLAAFLLADARAVAQGGVEGLPPEAAQDNSIIALGRLARTGPADARGYGILNIPDWTLDKNHAWVLALEQQGLSLRMVSPPSAAQLWDIRNLRPTVYALELAQLAELGYQRAGNWLIPPSSEQGRAVAGDTTDVFFQLEQRVNSLPDDVDRGSWLAEFIATQFGNQPVAGLAWPGLRSDSWGSLGRIQIEQLDDLLTVVGDAASDIQSSGGWILWGRRSESFVGQQRADTSRGWRARWRGLTLGATAVAGDWQLAFSLHGGSIRVSGRDGAMFTADARSTHLSAAARGPLGRLQMDFAAASGRLTWDGERHLRIASVGNPNVTSLTAATNTAGRAVAFSAGLAWPFEIDMWSLELRGGLRYARSDVDPFSEFGGDELDLHVSSSDIDSTAASIGGQVLLRHWVSPRLRLSWRHEIDRSKPRLSATFIETPGEGLEEHSATSGRNRVMLAAGIAIRPQSAPRFALDFDYNLQSAHRHRSESFGVAVGWQF